MAVAAVATSGVKAQSVTYNHDSPKQNQITVMETGTGALSPELYYTLLHNKYKKSAASKNKLSFRTLAGVNLYNQTDEAEAIDSALVKRAEIEALNVADRQIDLAWLAEGDKINAQMERLQRNIDRIPLAGGTTDDRERWTEYYHVYQCAIDATKDAYMPNAQRKKEYLRIYNELLIRGYNVDVGIVEVYAKNDEGKTTRKQFEVDFVVNQGSQRYYIQVAYDMTSEEKQKQEFNSFRNIPDSFKKIVVVNGTKKPWRNEEGFVIMGMKYFLLNADSLEF